MFKEFISISMLTTFLIIFAQTVNADGKPLVIETGFLNAETGDVGDQIGARVKRVETVGHKGSFVHIEIPVDPEKVDKVEIYDASGEEIPMSSQPDLIKNYHDDRVGVKLYAKKSVGLNFGCVS